MDQAANVLGVVLLVAVGFFVVKGSYWLATFDERWWKRLLEGADSAWHHIPLFTGETLVKQLSRNDANVRAVWAGWA